MYVSGGVYSAIKGIQSLKYEIEFWKSGHVKLEVAEADPIYIDVTHTIGCEVNTGIQRTVRSISRELINNSKVIFFRFDNTSRQPRLLMPDEMNALILFKGENGANFKVKGFFRSLAFFLGDLFSAIIRSTILELHEKVRLGEAQKGLRTIKTVAKYFSLKKISGYLELLKMLIMRPSKSSVLVFINSRCLVPEVLLESSRVESYKYFRSSGALKHMALIVYDLIPIKHPEFCISSDPFIRFTRLFHLVDRFYCISDSVKMDLQHFIAMQGKPFVQAPDIRTVYLAGGLPLENSRREERETVSFVCVGTIEPRKNQSTLLRAGYLLWKAGTKFKINFVGNLGWRASEFLEELDALDPKRDFTAVHFSVGESHLQALYSSAVASVFISFAEGFGLPILESLNMGVPVITSKEGSMGELANLCGGVVSVDPKDEVGLATLLERFITSGEFREYMNASIRVGIDQTWKNCADLLIAD
jgi:glycosyltransferase involved in cell wall biosynthesis